MTTPSKEYQSLYRAGLAAAQARDFDHARKLFRAALTLDETQKSGWLALAKLETDPAQKAELYRQILRLDPKDAVARAFLDGMRHSARPIWYRSRWALGLLGLLILLLGGAVALITSQPAADTGTLPTFAQLPSITASSESSALPLSVDGTEEVASTGTVEPSASNQPQATIFALDVTTSTGASPSDMPPPTATVQQLPPTAPVLPTGVIVTPPPAGPTATPGGNLPTVVTAPPTSTRASSATATEQPLFMDITGPQPTNLPVFATATPDFDSDFNTEVPPPDPNYQEDPNSGGGPRP